MANQTRKIIGAAKSGFPFVVIAPLEHLYGEGTLNYSILSNHKTKALAEKAMRSYGNTKAEISKLEAA